MRIVIDLQSMQSNSRFRGIGRFSFALTRALIKNSGRHEIFIALNGLLPETIQPIRDTFRDLLPQENICIWYSPAPVKAENPENKWRKEAAELVRETFLASLQPDIILITSLFEGFGDDVATSIGKLSLSIPTAVILYDLIPYFYRNDYLKNPIVEKWYEDKIKQLYSADILLAISNSSCQKAIDCLNFPEDSVVNILGAVDDHFKPQFIEHHQESIIRKRYSLFLPFVMYVSNIEHHKNIEGLIRAYGKLPQLLRSKHQLVLVLSSTDEERILKIKKLAEANGFLEGELLILSYLPEKDLLVLYNLCQCFIFPSLHEGFGLPALEAMSCGCAVIGSNTTSIPEVIGREDALFDPTDDASIAMKIEQVLTDHIFRDTLKKHGLEQAKKFSWDNTASRAVEALENYHEKNKTNSQSVAILSRRLKLAYFSPLPPQASGIADYSAELLPELSRFYEIEVIVDCDEISDPWIKANCIRRNVEWFKKNYQRYDRILYQFGNSPFHKHMFPLLEKIPGVVVLHDFFLSSVIKAMDGEGLTSFLSELYRSHGYEAVDAYLKNDVREVIAKYPVNLNILEKAFGIIVHSEHSKSLAEKWYRKLSKKEWPVIPLLRTMIHDDNRCSSRDALMLEQDEFIICSFGLLAETKLNYRLLEAFLASKLVQENNVLLIFVGGNGGAKEFLPGLISKIENAGMENRIFITGYADTKVYRQYLAIADLAVQLRTSSRGETSATVLDCMNYGIPTIINAHGSMEAIPQEAVWKLVDKFKNEELIEALESLYFDPQRRQEISVQAIKHIKSHHSPRKCATQYFEAIENFYKDSAFSLSSLQNAIIELETKPENYEEYIPLSNSIAQSISPRFAQKQIFIDISQLVCHDLNTGIERVVRNVLRNWLLNPPPDIRIEPVYAKPDEIGYRYARSFTLRLLGGQEVACLQDDPIEYRNGDIFLGLELVHNVILNTAYFQKMRNQGVQVLFVIYDLLPILMPEYFPDYCVEIHSKWLEVVKENDGAICISKTVAQELHNAVGKNFFQRKTPFTISWFHQGADLESGKSNDLNRLSPDQREMLALIKQASIFIMVGTIEPRKGHAQTLAAFEQLWREGYRVTLVIVGKQGWMVDEIIEKIQGHSELNKQLFWLNGISDAYLDAIYKAATCLIAASYGEGFGLPLIEAAQYKIPIVARNIPVFQEVTAGHAFYFQGNEPGVLAQSIKEWLLLFTKNTHQKSDLMPWQTWQQSAQQLLDILLSKKGASLPEQYIQPGLEPVLEGLQ